MRPKIHLSILAAAALWAGTHSASAQAISLLAGAEIELRVAGTYESGIFDEGAAEIAAYDSRRKQLFVTNADANTLDVLSIRNINKPRLRYTIDLSPYGGGVNSVAAMNGIVAVAVEAKPKQNPGTVVFFDNRGNYIDKATVGALPDMLTFTPDGMKVVVANEGEPSDDYNNDPLGTVSIIDLSAGFGSLVVNSVDFSAFNGLYNSETAVRVYGPGADTDADLEPEYIAVSDDSTTAWVTLQENNALAILDLLTPAVTKIVPLGTKDFGVIQNAIDASNEDGAIDIRAWPVVGMYQPDAIASYMVDGETYLVTANEGDARDYDGFSEEFRVKDEEVDGVCTPFCIDDNVYPDFATLRQNENLGRLRITNVTGDTDGDGSIDLLHAYGGRSFSILNSDGEMIFDSGSEFERLLADIIPVEFNSTNDENGSFDDRSDDKGPEPEGVTVGELGGKHYAFIGLERIGGIMVYDVSNPVAPRFVQYINNRDFSGDAKLGTAGDLGPEGVLFIGGASSPTRKPLLVVTNEVSGTTTIYRIRANDGADGGEDDDDYDDD